MNDAEVMFIARDASVEVLKEFLPPPFDFDEEDIGAMVFGTLIAEHDAGIKGRPERLAIVSLFNTDQRDAFRGEVQLLIEAAIYRAL